MTSEVPLPTAVLQLGTPHLVLRELQAADIPGLTAILLTPGVNAFMAMRATSAHAVHAELESRLESRLGSGYGPERRAFTFTISSAEQSDPMGMVTVAREPVAHRAMVSDLAIDPRNTRAGYGLEAGRAAIAFAFALPGVRRVWALRHHANTAGAALFRAAGMTEEGLLRGWLELDGRLINVFAHSLLDEQWHPTDHEQRLHRQLRTVLQPDE
ncbi:GNAT family N-acetyltransferase [Nocardia asteroides]